MPGEKLPKEEILRVVSKFYDNAYLIDHQVINAGHINQTFKLVLSLKGELEEQVVLLQNLNTHVFRNPEAVMNNIVRCARILQTPEAAYPFEILQPFPVKDSAGFLFREGKAAWRIFNFVENTNSLDFITSEEQAREIGSAFGIFLSRINRDDPEHYRVTIPDFHHFTKRYRGFSQFLKEVFSGDLDEKSRQMISEIHERAPEYLKLEELNFPRRLAHHDTKANNVLLDAETGKTRAIIDLDTLMPGDVFSDFGDLIRTVLNPFEEDRFPESQKTVDSDLYLALSRSFFEPMEEILTQEEKGHMMTGGKKIILLQVIRFLEDYLQGDQYYQVKYPGHNLDRAYSQMNLLKAIENTRLEFPRT